MAAAGVEDELTCPICTNIYEDPVTLACGHSYCRLCITRTWDNQEERESSCPECRRRFRVRPELHADTRLCKLVKNIRLPLVWQNEVGKTCAHCQSPIAAVRMCCDVFLCSTHLVAHRNSIRHILNDSTTILSTLKCALHNDNLKYFCYHDAVCICESCGLIGDHRGHHMGTLEEASEKKKEKLRNILEKLTSQREEAEKRVQSLEELRRQVQEKAAREAEEVTALIRDIREQLEALEKRVLREISSQEQQASYRVSNLIRQLEIKKEELSRKMGDIVELCDTTDPLPLLQERESDRADYCDTEDEDNEDLEKDDVHNVGDLDMTHVRLILGRGMTDVVMSSVKQWQGLLEATDTLSIVDTVSDILLGVNATEDTVNVSGEVKTVSWSETNRISPEAFLCYQVLSTRRFSSGQHCWEVETSETGDWTVGMAYNSSGENRFLSHFRSNTFWCLSRVNNDYLVSYERTTIQNLYMFYHRCFNCRNPITQLSNQAIMLGRAHCDKLRIVLEYDNGRLSFYEQGDMNKLVWRFNATFTEPLHVLLHVGRNASVTVKNQEY
uniref:Uncharacterized protein n=1 Tax=Leptobrachium leishanense TaxID=445787 RepID=A0A8C5MNX6_9ANUR